MSPAAATEPQRAPAASNPQVEKMRHSLPILKGYIRKRDDGRYEGMCLTLNLPVRGRTLEETERKLFDLITAYLQDAHESGTWEQMVPRRAPASYYATFYKLIFQYHFKSLVDFKLFVQSAPSCRAHA